MKVELLDRLDWHEPHRRSLRGFDDHPRIEVIVLVRLQERLHELWCNQPDIVAEGGDLTRKMMGTTASFHRDEAIC